MSRNTRNVACAASAFAAAAALAAPARAAVVSYTVPAATRGDESAPNTLPGFDDASGALTDAAVSFSGTISGTASSPTAIIRPESITVSPYLTLGGLAAFNLGVDLPDLTATPTYTATGGYRLSWSEAVDTAPLTVSLDAIGESDVRYTIAGGYGICPNPATTYDNGAPFTGTATVAYTYTPTTTTPAGSTDVPEPATFAVLGIGLAAARRRVT